MNRFGRDNNRFDGNVSEHEDRPSSKTDGLGKERGIRSEQTSTSKRDSDGRISSNDASPFRPPMASGVVRNLLRDTENTSDACKPHKKSNRGSRSSHQKLLPTYVGGTKVTVVNFVLPSSDMWNGTQQRSSNGKQYQRSHRSNRNVLREEKEMDSKGTGPTYDKLRSPETTRKTFTSTSDLNGLQSTRRSNQTNGSMSELPNDVSSNTISSTESSSIERDNATKLCRVSSTCFSADEVRLYLSQHVDPSDEDTIANFYKSFGRQIMEFNYFSNTETLEINSRRYNILEEHYEYYQKSKCLVLGTVENIAAWVVYDFSSKEIYLTSHVGDSQSNLDGSDITRKTF